MSEEKVSRKEEKAILEAAHRFLKTKPKTFDERLMQDLQVMGESWLKAYGAFKDSNAISDLGFEYTQFTAWVRNGYADGYREWFRSLTDFYSSMCDSLRADVNKLAVQMRNDNDLLVEAQTNLEQMQDDLDADQQLIDQMKADAEKFGRRDAVRTLLTGKKKK